MRKIVPMLAAAAAALVFSATARAEEWKEQSLKDCQCTASFPGTPQTRTQKMQSAVGSLDSTMFLLEVPGQAFYALAYVDYPKELAAKPDELLDGARDGAVAKIKGQLKTENKITLAGAPGRELRIEAPGDVVLQARIYLVNQRLYQSIVVVQKGRADAPENKKFLESFKFDKR